MSHGSLFQYGSVELDGYLSPVWVDRNLSYRVIQSQTLDLSCRVIQSRALDLSEHMIQSVVMDLSCYVIQSTPVDLSKTLIQSNQLDLSCYVIQSHSHGSLLRSDSVSSDGSLEHK